MLISQLGPVAAWLSECQDTVWTDKDLPVIYRLHLSLFSNKAALCLSLHALLLPISVDWMSFFSPPLFLCSPPGVKWKRWFLIASPASDASKEAWCEIRCREEWKTWLLLVSEWSWPKEWRLQLWQIAAGAVPHIINLSGPNSQER